MPLSYKNFICYDMDMEEEKISYPLARSWLASVMLACADRNPSLSGHLHYAAALNFFIGRDIISFDQKASPRQKCLIKIDDPDHAAKTRRTWI